MSADDRAPTDRDPVGDPVGGDATGGPGDGALDDDALLELLGAAIAEHDPVPASATRFALESQRLVALRDELGELAALTDDSLVGASATRSATTEVRTLVFESDGGEVVVEVAGAEVTGSVEPAVPGTRVAVRSSDGSSLDVAVNDRGFFRCARPDGLVRFEIETGVGRTVTDWVRL